MSDDDAFTPELTDELDLHTFAPSDVASVVEEYVRAAHEAGFTLVRIIHGKGTGTLRRIVHGVLERDPHVARYRPADANWGATLAELVPSAWTAVELRGLAIPAPPSRDARVDARYLDDGDLLDGARVRDVCERLGAGTEAAIVRVRGRTAIRATVVQDGATTIAYEIADAPIDRDGALHLPRWRVVFALSSPIADELARRFEDDAPAWQAALAAHETDASGHLSFGPIAVPRGWSLIGDDGEPIELGACATPMREIFVGGGALVLVDLSARGLRPQLLLRPRAPDRTSEETLGQMLARERGESTRIVSIGETRVGFVGGTVTAVHWHSARAGDDVALGAAYLWRDVLGYAWELEYVAPIDAGELLAELIAYSAGSGGAS
jgi:hypothetical protein